MKVFSILLVGCAMAYAAPSILAPAGVSPFYCRRHSDPPLTKKQSSSEITPSGHTDIRKHCTKDGMCKTGKCLMCQVLARALYPWCSQNVSCLCKDKTNHCWPKD